MPHIQVNEELPGIRALLAFSPATAAPLGELAELLLRSEDGLSRAERELIATYVSYLNDCFYCNHSHGEIATYYLCGNSALVEQVRLDFMGAEIPARLKALLYLAEKVQQGGTQVTKEDVETANLAGATEDEIHDAVLISASFCLFNRYVDGLAANTPTDLSTYAPRAKQVAENGYGSHIFQSDQPA
ncbi:MAG TPA: peroxidase-related enzyme [Chitinophagaceae bacterium]|jgi:uncharacterized peroxidase-related enzyme|nr:peroxidase-related enzyme [Chitinophagaceae bacterium]